jgi:hypothetical protein
MARLQARPLVACSSWLVAQPPSVICAAWSGRVSFSHGAASPLLQAQRDEELEKARMEKLRLQEQLEKTEEQLEKAEEQLATTDADAAPEGSAGRAMEGFPLSPRARERAQILRV